MPKPYGYVSPEFLRGIPPEMFRIKEKSYALSKLDTVQRVLDAGCGPGIDTVQMALKIKKGGKITGVDIDEQMITEANHWAAENHVSSKVEHVLADVYALPFKPGYFDVCRAERLFQNIPVQHRADLVLDELLRVLRHGGRIVLIDTDFASGSLDFSDGELERRMMHYAALHWRPDGLAGRKLFGMLKGAGVQQIKTYIYPIPFRDVKYLAVGEFLANKMLEEGVITNKEATDWVTELTRLDQERKLFFSVNMHMVTGIKK